MEQDPGEKENPMQELCIHQLCLNLCVQEFGESLTQAAKRNEKIAIHCIVHGAKAEEILGLKVQEKNNYFDTGNFGLGIQEHIWESDMTQALVSMAWISMWYYPVLSITDKQHRQAVLGPVTEWERGGHMLVP
ncbi:unnamed protein product [Nyctereutes procyonoides]|uniref:(raccoon dog) hypothetical protein n=1 Tax=Nyctereutes procyonoides TaxID=34880 RepID=A0A811Z3F2_NYCPR|nr:unnamed protein product [Nyctereutes procyonoides]